MQKTRILLLFGGRSVEHEISIRSSQNVFNYLDKDIYEPVLVGSNKTRQWYLQNEINSRIDQEHPVSLDLSAASPSMRNINSGEAIPFELKG